MTMRKLAELAGVSVSTISKAFSGSKEVSVSQRERIFELAREHGCYEKYCKSNFKGTVIAVLCPEFQSGYYTQQLDYFAQEIRKRGGVMLTGSYDFDKAYKTELLRYFVEGVKVDGVILYGLSLGRMCYDTPMVVLGRSDAYDSVQLSWEQALAEALEYLVQNGHRDIGFIGEKYTQSKYLAFRRIMDKMGMPVNDKYIECTDERFQIGGYKAMEALLAMEKPPTAVFAAYDGIAMGAMRSIREHGLRIPEDISVIGMDDCKECAYVDVSLSSVSSYNEGLCEIVVDILFDRILNGQIGKKKHIKVSAEFIRRESVGAAKKE